MRSRFHSTALHSLGWLVGANLVGLWMASILLVPRLGDPLAPLTYGRWATVHLDAQLYGWCSVPILGLLFRAYGPTHGFERASRVALWSWTGALLVACAGWLAGVTGAKPFMEWSSFPRVLFPLNMVVLTVVLAVGLRAQQRERRDAAWLLIVKIAILAAAASIPFVMYWSASPELYPPTNPDSGGATGGSLLGSTLGIVALILACPLAIGLRPRRWRTVIAMAAILVAHMVAFGFMDHGDHSHHEVVQIIGLFSLIIWWPLLTLHLRLFTWPGVTKRWLAALCAWAGILLATALFTFLPGVLEAWKFTNALVAHSHIAMAGMLSAFNMVLLGALTESNALAAPRPFWLWNAGCLVLCGSLLALGTVEAASPAALFRSLPLADAFYGVRWLAGAAMCAASIEWLLLVRRPSP